LISGCAYIYTEIEDITTNDSELNSSESSRSTNDYSTTGDNLFLDAYSEESDNYYIYDSEIAFHSFFGVWHISEAVLYRRTIYDLDHEFRYSIAVDILDFLGWELEFSHNFVRLGERKMYDPNYRILSMPSELYLFGSNVIWVEEYFYSPHDFINILSERGVIIGYESDITNTLYVKDVFISYPDPLMFRGELFDPDPELFEQNIAFNPLFEGFVLLNNDYMLVGRAGILLLAYRIN